MKFPAALRVLAVIGTRPEVIKSAPVVRCLSAAADLFSVAVCKVEQQDGVLNAALAEWELEPAHTIEARTSRRTPLHLLASVLPELEDLFCTEKPDLVLVQGDTLTAFAGALAAAYAGCPAAHVEAGLRSGHRAEPFPEEMHRLLIDQMALILYAPTPLARDNLLRSGFAEEQIRVVGNTGIDAMRLMLGRLAGRGWRVEGEESIFPPPAKRCRRSLLVTAHRRESFDGGIDRLCTALRELVRQRADLEIHYVLHPNPRAHEPVRAHLDGAERVRLLQPVGYRDFLSLLLNADLVLTDSGGVQEEAPYLGKPVLIARDRTERPEALELGTAELVGTDPAAITAAINRLLDCPELYRRRAVRTEPFGDGWAAERIRDDLRQRFQEQGQGTAR